MTNLLDHILRVPLLDTVDDWPKSATRNQWFEIARKLVQETIAEMDLGPEAMREVEQAFMELDCCDQKASDEDRESTAAAPGGVSD